MPEAAMFSEGVDAKAAAREEHEVVALKYRPQTFEQLVGQEHVWKGLVGAIQSNRVGHGVSLYRRTRDGEDDDSEDFCEVLELLEFTDTVTVPCEKCDSCVSISDRGSDIDVIEIDAASTNGVDDVRDLRAERDRAADALALQDLQPRRSAHDVQSSVQRAVKTLEEPPPHVKFYLLHDRSREDSDHDPLALPAVRFRSCRNAENLTTTDANRRS